MKIPIGNMNYYIALFININNVFNKCDLEYILNHLNLIISKMLSNILCSCNCSCKVLWLVNGWKILVFLSHMWL